MTSFWSAWVIVLTAFTIVAITWVLVANRKRDSGVSERTTGHEYDGIEELSLIHISEPTRLC